MTPLPTTTPILLDHDGAVDDFLALLLLSSIDVELKAVVVTPADCHGPPALDATRKVLRLTGRGTVPTALSRARAVNPFPPSWRHTSYVINNLPALYAEPPARSESSTEPGEAVLAAALREAGEPLTLLVTGPLTGLATVVDAEPALAGSIDRLVWMGGAIDVAGNVLPDDEPDHDGSAEWNAYWDPFAVERILAGDIDVVMCPLDVTVKFPLDQSLVPWFAERRNHELADVAGQMYALVAHREYYAWDLITGAYAVWPDLFTTGAETLAVDTAGSSQGRTHRSAAGSPVTVVTGCDVEGLFTRLHSAWTG